MKSSKSTFQLSLDFRLLSALLGLAILIMLVLWRPWSMTNADGRTIQVTGEAVVTAEPNEYIFYPTYEFKNSDKQAAINAAAKKITQITAKLKRLGVTDNQIKSDASGYGKLYYTDANNDTVYTASLTITLTDKAVVDKVQDYLATTTPTGAVTPQAQFSDNQRKELESQARDDATQDAHAKAEQTAGNLGAHLGKVKSVTDGAGFGGPIALDGVGTASVRDGAEMSISSAPAFPVQPGENKLNYTVTVTYYLR